MESDFFVTNLQEMIYNFLPPFYAHRLCPMLSISFHSVPLFPLLTFAYRLLMASSSNSPTVRSIRENFFNGWQLQYGRAPGAFLTFSLLPGIGRTGVSLSVTLWLSGVVVNRTFTSGGIDVCTRLFVVDHRHVNVFIRVLNFRGVILTAKFSRTTVFSPSSFLFHFTDTPLGLVCGRHSHVQCIMPLLSGGAHIDFRGKDGLTPLHRAAIGGNSQAVKVQSPIHSGSHGNLPKKIENLCHSGVEFQQFWHVFQTLFQSEKLCLHDHMLHSLTWSMF